MALEISARHPHIQCIQCVNEAQTGRFTPEIKRTSRWIPVLSTLAPRVPCATPTRCLQHLHAALPHSWLLSRGSGVATVMNMPPLHWAVFLIGVYGLMFLTEKNRDNGMGLVFTFALTGLLGYSLAPSSTCT